MNTNQNIISIADVSQKLLDVFLEPYKENCKYLKKAQFQYSKTKDFPDKAKDERQILWSIKADFAIPESCYIVDTGHFNSVEFNICYNQLFYTIIAYLLENKLLEVMRNWDLKTYQRRQLSDFLIVKFSSTFKKPINAKNFQGTLSIHKCSSRNSLIIFKTSCIFYDDAGGWAEGDITIAVLNSQESVKFVNVS